MIYFSLIFISWYSNLSYIFILFKSDVKKYFSISMSQSLSCKPCNKGECAAPPACCKSGFYTSDICGCCQVNVLSCPPFITTS